MNLFTHILSALVALPLAFSCGAITPDAPDNPEQTQPGNGDNNDNQGGVENSGTDSRTLVVWYSYTGNIGKIVDALKEQVKADFVEVKPAEEGLKYEADNYALGSALISAIRNNPNAESSYPAIKTTLSALEQYDTVIVATPLWWSQMAAPMQTLLFKYGKQLAGKKIGLIVSSHSSGISGVEADAKRLIPDGDFSNESLWIRSAQTSNSQSLVAEWLAKYRGELQTMWDNQSIQKLPPLV